MNFSRLLSLTVVAAALLVTVPLKLADVAGAKQSLSRNLQQAIVAMLASEGYEIKIGDIFGSFVVNAQHENCRLQLREAAAQGYNADAIESASKGAQLAFAYRGELWQQHPTLRATIAEIWNRFKWHLRIDILVAGGFSCRRGPCTIKHCLGENR